MRPRAHHERGFGMIEIVVVMAIVGVLVAIAAVGLRSSQGAGSQTIARTAGANYKDAIEAFRRDHGGRVPVWGNPLDWPTTPNPALNKAAAGANLWGPVNTGSSGRPYLDRIPEGMSLGRVELQPAPGAAPASGGVKSRVLYERVGAAGYRLRVQQLQNSTWIDTCEYGTQGGKRC